MGTQSIVHGRIILKDSVSKAIEFIRSLGNDEVFPFIRTEMFNIGATELPFFYNEPILTFGATYKSVEYDWKSFIIKYEHILRNLEFDTAKITLETEFYGTYYFFWKRKTGDESFKEENNLVETDEWFFGYGNRDRWGLLDDLIFEKQIFSLNGFQYPINFNNEMKTLFNSFIEKITSEGITSEIYLDDYLKFSKILSEKEIEEDLYPILVHLKVHDFIDFKIESGRGYLINVKRELEKF